VPDRWGDMWQVRHQVLTRLAKYFYVVWVNPAHGWRTYKWDKLWSERQPYRKRLDCPVPSRPGLTIYQPGKLLPGVGRPRLVSRMIEQRRLRQSCRILADRGCKAVIAYLWRTGFAPAVDFIPHAITCYHIDDEYTFSPIEKPLRKEEAALISRVNQVFIHSPALLEKKGGLNPNTLCIPNGVDYCAFSTPVGEPADMRAIPHPRVGYVGSLKADLDLALLVTLARRHREWSFVFIGPEKKSFSTSTQVVQELARMPNVYFLGRKPVEAIPGYVQHLDVCMLCYVLNGYTKFIYPLKLHEYLASGRPVVGAPIRSLLEFTDVVSLACTPDEWSAALANLLRPEANAPAKVEARRAVARRYEWDDLVRLIARTMCERLGPDYIERFRGILAAETDATV
jgi:glycosyltransferase involved in cell wall biosynthesis